MSEDEKAKSASARLWRALVNARCAEHHCRNAARADLISRMDRELDQHAEPAGREALKPFAMRPRRNLAFPF